MPASTRRRLTQLGTLVAIEVSLGVALLRWAMAALGTGLSAALVKAAGFLFFTLMPILIVTVLALWVIDARHSRGKPAA